MNTDSNLPLGVIILAAGQSERMGSPKPLLRLGDKTLLEHVLANAFLRRDGVHPMVVLGHSSEIIRASVSITAPWVENPKYTQGRITSVQCGLRALPADITGTYIWPVDCPLVPASVMEALAEAFGGPRTICIPSHNFRRGHPPLIGAWFFGEILSMKEDQPLRTLYEKYPNSIQHVTVNTETVLHNLNTPEEFQAVQEGFGNLTNNKERAKS
jgi:molybdenum cofactor cytidylyltransferase